ncbi:MAG: histidinol-phosphate transaminase [Bryobacterales bacterium]|nr:histidinol-phosphate transaminase [Bryobacteraceae bacterium]MDW8353651.1 histidinol-phosphate transaminase [Bryobacterales bacterium]
MSERVEVKPAVLEPREAIRRMAPYTPPTAGRAGKLRLDFNENTLGCSPRVVEFLRARLNGEILAVYPEYEEAIGDLAAHFGVAPAELLLTNGTDEAIQLVLHTYVDAGQEVLLCKPSYAMYRFYADVAGAAVREIPYRRQDLSFPLDELLAALSDRTRAVLIANPNNPTGTGVSLEGIRRILERAPRAAVLIDEAYYEFNGVTALDLRAEAPNLFVSRTFSKVYGLAGLRLGCVFSQAPNIAALHKGQSPYSVNILAALAAREAVKDRQYIEAYVQEALAARALLYEGLERLGIRYFPSQANFVLFDAGARAVEIRDRLRQRGVLVRDRSYELPGCLRVTVGTREQIRRFLEALEEVWR